MNEQLQFVDTDGLCNGLVSVRLSVCPIDRPQHWLPAVACGGFAAGHPVGRRYRSTAAALGAQQQRRRSNYANADSVTVPGSRLITSFTRDNTGID